MTTALPVSASGVNATLPAATGNSALDAYTGAALNALGTGVNYAASPTYQQLSALLGPGANGGLNSNLLAQYNAAQPLIGQQTETNMAQALSGAQGNGLGGSSIAAQGVENAEFGGTMADASLLSSLYGQQNSNTQALAGDLASGANAEMSDLLNIYDSAGTSAANMSMYSQGLQEALQAANASSNASLLGGGIGAAGSIIGGALSGGLL